MNQYKITLDRLKEIAAHIKAGTKNAFLKTFKVEVDGKGLLTYKGKRIIPKEHIEDVIRDAIRDDGPLGIESLFWHLYQSYWGISRRVISAFLHRQESYQLLKRRPAKHKSKSNYKWSGVTEGYDKKKYGTVLGIDLVEPSQGSSRKAWIGKTKNILVVVHKKSLFVWTAPMPSKKAPTTLSKFKPILKDAESKFGPITQIDMDGGFEFLGPWRPFMQEKKIKRQVLSKVTYVEKANSTIQRYMHLLGDGYEDMPFTEALQSATKKKNNIKSRSTGATAVSLIGNPNIKRKHRKQSTTGRARKRKTLRIHPGDRVRYMLPYADEKNIMYKSYIGLLNIDAKRGPRWSRTVYNVVETKVFTGKKKYRVNGMWKFKHKLQLIKGEVEKAKPRYKAKPKPKSQKPAVDRVKPLPKKRKPQPTKGEQTSVSAGYQKGDLVWGRLSGGAWQPGKVLKKLSKTSYRVKLGISKEVLSPFDMKSRQGS
mgnify:CR=1 FL=1